MDRICTHGVGFLSDSSGSMCVDSYSHQNSGVNRLRSRTTAGAKLFCPPLDGSLEGAVAL